MPVVPAKQRRQAIWAAIKWWLSGDEAPVAQLRAIVREQSRLSPAAPEMDWSEAVPAGFSGDGRWWLLARPNTEELRNITNTCHRRTALACAWLREAPSLEMAQWARELFIGLPVPEGATQENLPKKFYCSLQAALLWEPTPAGKVVPATIETMSASERAWALRWASAINAKDQAIALAQAQGGFLVASDRTQLPLLGWLTLFGRATLLGLVLEEGADVNVAISFDKLPLFESAKTITQEWQQKLEALYDPPIDPSQKPAVRLFDLSLSWNGFNASRWAAMFNQPKCLQKLIDHGVRLDEFADIPNGSSLCAALHECNLEVAALLVRSGAPVCRRPGVSPDKYEHGARFAEQLANIEGLICKEDNAYAQTLYEAVLDGLKVALRREKMDATDQPWGAAMVSALHQNAPQLAKVLVEFRGNRAWGTWHQTTTDRHTGTKTVQSFPEMAIEASKGKVDTVLEAMAGTGMGLTDFVSTTCPIPVGFFIAAFVPSALKAWLDAADSGEIAALLKAQTPGKKKAIANSPFPASSNLWLAAMRSNDPGRALAALLENTHTQASWMNSNIDIHCEALVMAGHGRPAALEATLRLLPAPAWSPSAVIKVWEKALTRPFDIQAIQAAIAKWPVDVALDQAGNTPLHQAVQNEDTELMEWLIKGGANPDRPNAAGQTPRDLASVKKTLAYALVNAEGAVLDAQAAPAAAPSVRPVRL